MTYTTQPQDAPLKLVPLQKADLSTWQDNAPGRHRRWVAESGFEAEPGQWCVLPDADGRREAVLFGVTDDERLYALAELANALPAGDYALEADWPGEARSLAALGWGLAQYRFDRYTNKPPAKARLVLEPDVEAEVRPLLEAQCLVRDLVNTPTEHMGPDELEAALKAEAHRFGANVRVFTGDELLDSNFPAVHVVGRAAARAPRLLELTWGEDNHPLLALCGKGVCFDTGGLNIKPAAGMRVMKKDMGGAAHVLGLARLVMHNELPVRLQVLIPAVENNIDGNAYRPGDVISTRQGLSVEIGNTDAEGRIVLSDALTLACEGKPDLVMDFATLTGAARIAMGPDVPPVFSNRAAVAQGLVAAGNAVADPLWELPLYAPYRDMLKSPLADLCNIGKSSYGGCITAALFLEHFVTGDTAWAHIDTFAWNQANRPGRPEGGEALGLRATWHYLQARYGSPSTAG